MENYFRYVLDSLTIEDTDILGILYEEDATAKVKAIKNVSVYEKSGKSEATFRKIVARLSSMRFIEVNSTYNEHSLYITEYGIQALEVILDSMKGSEEV